MRFFSRSEWLLIVVVGSLVTVLVTAGYVRSFEAGDVDHGRAMALAMLTLSSAVLTAALSWLRTMVSRAIAGIGSLLVGILPLLFDYVRSIRRHAGGGGHAEGAHGIADRAP